MYHSDMLQFFSLCQFNYCCFHCYPLNVQDCCWRNRKGSLPFSETYRCQLAYYENFDVAETLELEDSMPFLKTRAHF